MRSTRRRCEDELNMHADGRSHRAWSTDSHFEVVLDPVERRVICEIPMLIACLDGEAHGVPRPARRLHRSNLALDGRPGRVDAAGGGFRSEGGPLDMDPIDPNVESVFG